MKALGIEFPPCLGSEFPPCLMKLPRSDATLGGILFGFTEENDYSRDYSRNDYSRTEDHFSVLIAARIEAAKRGDGDAANSLLREFVGTYKQSIDENGKQLVGPRGPILPLRHNVFAYVAECLAQILEGVPADKALGITKGEPGARKKPRRVMLDARIDLCRQILQFNETVSVTDAIERVASKNKVPIGRVQKAWKDKNAQLCARLHREALPDFKDGT